MCGRIALIVGVKEANDLKSHVEKVKFHVQILGRMMDVKGTLRPKMIIL